MWFLRDIPGTHHHRDARTRGRGAAAKRRGVGAGVTASFPLARLCRPDAGRVATLALPVRRQAQTANHLNTQGATGVNWSDAPAGSLAGCADGCQNHRRRALNAIQRTRERLTVATIQMDVIARRIGRVESDCAADDEGHGLRFEFSRVT